MKYFLIIMIAIIYSNICNAQIIFNDFFKDETMRIDYFHTGDAKSEMMTIDQVFQIIPHR